MCYLEHFGSHVCVRTRHPVQRFLWDAALGLPGYGSCSELLASSEGVHVLPFCVNPELPFLLPQHSDATTPNTVVFAENHSYAKSVTVGFLRKDALPNWKLTGRKSTSNIPTITACTTASCPLPRWLQQALQPCARGFVMQRGRGRRVSLGISPSLHTPVSPSPHTRLPLLSHPCVLQQGPGTDASSLGTRVPELAVLTRDWARGATTVGWQQDRARGPKHSAGGEEQRDIPFFHPHRECLW